jgi:hypothetical protein
MSVNADFSLCSAVLPEKYIDLRACFVGLIWGCFLRGLLNREMLCSNHHIVLKTLMIYKIHGPIGQISLNIKHAMFPLFKKGVAS